jgi:hypothetical protein
MDHMMVELGLAATLPTTPKAQLLLAPVDIGGKEGLRTAHEHKGPEPRENPGDEEARSKSHGCEYGEYYEHFSNFSCRQLITNLLPFVAMSERP